jgi:hypothetical protein
MQLPRVVPIVAGALALLATTAVLAIHIVVSTQITYAQAVRTTAIASAALQALTLVAVGWIYVSYFSTSNHTRSWTRLLVEFGLGVVCCLAAAAASVATLVNLGQPQVGKAAPKKGTQPDQFLVGCAVAFGVALAFQAVFLVMHYVIAKNPLVATPTSYDSNSDEEKRRPALVHVKSIPYSQTTAPATRSVRSMSFETVGSTIGGRSRSNTINSARSARSSISQANHPPSVKAKLAPSHTGERGVRRAISLDSSLRPNLLRPEDAYTVDSWEVASVDGLKLDVSRPASRFLETIPASPTVSCRTPSPSTAIHGTELEVPRAVRRSRSCSPIPSRESLCASPTPSFVMMQANTSEAHIHPLFRSDSPIPPPAATPGTVVLASPDAGRILASRQSIQSLKRFRSGSLPPAPSPLGRQAAFEDFAVATQRHPAGRHRSRSQASSSGTRSSEEMIPSIVEPAFIAPSRAMTPPIPDWILGAGSSTSLTGYNTRRSNESEEERISS